MLETRFIPVGTMLHLTAAAITPDQVTVHLVAAAPDMPCPRCQAPASRIHSRYQRTLADLPLLQWPVCLFLHVRRFFCDQADCPQRAFCERLPALVHPGARRTSRLSSEQQRLGLESSAEAGARLARRQGMAVSPSTFGQRDHLQRVPSPDESLRQRGM